VWRVVVGPEGFRLRVVVAVVERLALFWKAHRMKIHPKLFTVLAQGSPTGKFEIVSFCAHETPARMIADYYAAHPLWCSSQVWRRWTSSRFRKAVYVGPTKA
jgi:hypothetical protein